MKERILIVEDQFVEANNLQMILERAGYEVTGIARSVPKALQLIEQARPGFVLLDIFLQGPLTGINLAIILRDKNIPFVYLSANSNRETLEAAKATCPYGFLVKPFREKDVLVTLEIARYLHANNLRAMMQKEPSLEKGDPSRLLQANLHDITGNSAQIKTLLHQLKIVAATDTSVLVLGESGTGKERIAGLLHEWSDRNTKPLVKVNCAALPATLIESILFGHERGAFTGATERYVGKFEQAREGTIFLDEIGELPLEVQAKLLRVLQEKEIERVGGKETIRVNIRIIAATNRHLEREVAEGRFRMDLYYRLNVFPLSLPPLRDRKEDIPLLADHFISVYKKKAGKAIDRISDSAMALLMNYDWPGNIRELEHTIERAILLSEDNVIGVHVLPDIHRSETTGAHKIKTIEENEREHITTVLKLCNGKIFGEGGAAELLGMNVSTLNSRIKKLGIEKIKPFQKKP